MPNKKAQQSSSAAAVAASSSSVAEAAAATALERHRIVGLLLAVLVVIAAVTLNISRPDGNDVNATVVDGDNVDGPEFIALDEEVTVTCSDDYEDDGCTPRHCVRASVGAFLSPDETRRVRRLVDTALAVSGGGTGGPSVFDVVSGAASRGQQFVDVFKMIKKSQHAFESDDFRLYHDITERIRALITDKFGLDAAAGTLHLTTPSFISRIDGGVKSNNMHDEYWHEHVDKLQYGSFTYTALVYLSDIDRDFEGGLFQFDAPAEGGTDATHKTLVRPRDGRLSLFTSGAENPHHVTRVTSGRRYAMTIAFTCDATRAVSADHFLKHAARSNK